MMNTEIGKFLGFDYESLTDNGTMGAIVTPFLFKDEDPVPVYVETSSSTIRFFDDGEILRRMMGWGIPVGEDEDIAFLNALIGPCGATLNAEGEIEVSVAQTCAPVGFASYMSAMLAIVQWEKEPEAMAQAQRRGHLWRDFVGA